MKALTLYKKMAVASMRAKMQYKFDFVVGMVINAAMAAVDFALLAAILARFQNVAGWNIYEVGVLYGISGIAMSVYRTLAPELHNFERYIVQGEFDALLIRPWPTLFVLLGRNIEPQRLGGMLQGAIILAISVRSLWLAGNVGAWEVAAFVLLGLVGSLVPMSLSLITASVAFWTVRVGDLQTFTMYAPTTASQYPLGIYPNWLKGLLTSLLPVAFINFIPVRYLLGKGGAPFHLIMSPVVIALFTGAAYLFWRIGERHYHSTGS